MLIILILIAILCITGLEIIALVNGIDGQVLSIAIGAIAAVITGPATYIYGRKTGYKAGKEEFKPPSVPYEE